VSADATLYLERLAVGAMQNWAYLIGSRAKRQCLVVDPAWDVGAILRKAEQDGMEVVGALVSHWHPDHVGGDLFGHDIEGLATLLTEKSVPIHVNRHELEGVAKVTGVSKKDLVGHDGGEKVDVGDVAISLLHTPGHTPGSQCFMVGGALVSGDTLFLEGCGRTDLPGGDPAALYESLTQRLAKVPDDAVLFPGHFYSADPAASMGDTRRFNYVYRPRSLEQWLMMFGQ
jgi:hydroxyacylglutathione hydrolase